MKNATTVMEAISLKESALLLELEQTIELGVKTFIEVGDALARVRDERLYRADFATFQEYCQERWGFTRHRANQLIETSGVAKSLPAPLVNKFTNERQVNALAKLPKEKRVKVAKEIIAKVKKSGKKLTAKIVKAAVAKENGEPKSAALAPSKEDKWQGSKATPLTGEMAVLREKIKSRAQREFQTLTAYGSPKPKEILEMFFSVLDAMLK